MENIVERIADFSDIDTRRAMGFPPRKLKVTFELPQWTREDDGDRVVWLLGEDAGVSRILVDNTTSDVYYYPTRIDGSLYFIYDKTVKPHVTT